MRSRRLVTVGVLVFVIVVGTMALELGLTRLYLPPPEVRPVFAEQPRVLPVHRALWSQEEGGPMRLERMNFLNFVRMFRTGHPSRGARLADRLASLSLRSGGSTSDRVLGRVSLAAWISRHATAEQLIVALGEKEYFGQAKFGLEVAARYWFDRRPEELTWAQAAILVGLVRMPAKLDPACHEADALERRAWALGQFEKDGLITTQERALADAEPLGLGPAAHCPSAKPATAAPRRPPPGRPSRPVTRGPRG